MISTVSTGAKMSKTDFKAACTVAEVVGNPVYLYSGGSVRNAIASDIDKARVVGVVVEKLSGIECIVRKIGEANISGLTAGNDYFLSEVTAGELTLFPPTGLGSFVVRICHCISSDRVYIDCSILTIKRSN